MVSGWNSHLFAPQCDPDHIERRIFR